uniref:Ig-like domain-containing protein n=1 Tax=Poecilia reticulata TaxID=8081 RepID=A0A3P9N1P5_POERE
MYTFSTENKKAFLYLVFLASNCPFVVLTVSSRVSVTLEPKWSQIYRGEKVTLRCEIRREETQWTYEWRPNRNSATSSEYKINSATESDSGEYRCRAKSGYKLTDWSDAFRLSVLCESNSPLFMLIFFPLNQLSIMEDLGMERSNGEKTTWINLEGPKNT